MLSIVASLSAALAPPPSASWVMPMPEIRRSSSSSSPSSRSVGGRPPARPTDIFTAEAGVQAKAAPLLAGAAKALGAEDEIRQLRRLAPQYTG